MEYVYAAVLLHKAGKEINDAAIKKVLEAAGVKVANDQTGKIIDVVKKFNQGNTVFADGANKDGHW